MSDRKENQEGQENTQKKRAGRPKGVTKEVMLKRIAENNPYRRLKQPYASVSLAESSTQDSSSEMSRLRQESSDAAKSPSDAQTSQENQSQQTTDTTSSQSSKEKGKKSLILCKRFNCFRWHRDDCPMGACPRLIK